VSTAALHDPEAWSRLATSERLICGESIARALDVGLRVGPDLVGDAGLVSLSHDHWPGLRFVVVPGGRLQMGLGEADLEELSEYIDWTRSVRLTTDAMLALATPVHTVEVRPFLVAERRLKRAEVEKLSAGFEQVLHTDEVSREAALRLMACMSMRLPSEAELEWLARDGGRFSFINDCGRAWSERRPWPISGSFGVTELSQGEWAADDWFDSYAGAASTSEARLGGAPCGVFRGELPYGPEQDKTELCYGLAAHRNRGAVADDRDSDHAFFAVRPVLDLP
jgi:hypothetical protein